MVMTKPKGRRHEKAIEKGILGGAGNPLYYNKVMEYAELKYRKRYLLKLMRKQNNS